MIRKQVKGYTDFGSIVLPVLPQYCIFTDRADGTLWYLSHSSDGTRIALNDGTISVPLKRIFAAFDEPYTQNNPRMRVFVRSGRIGYELRALPQGEQDNDTMRLLSRRVNENVQREMISPANFTEAHLLGITQRKGVLAWEDSI